jgi:TP901 family phage tail tape measure protein
MGRGMRQALVSMGVDNARLDRDLSGAHKRFVTFGGRVAGELKNAGSRMWSSFGDVAGLGGLIGLAVATKNVHEFETRLGRLQIASRSSAGAMADLRKQIYEVSKARGIEANQLLGGIEQYVALTGDIKGATAALDGFATVASATGSEMGDITQAAAALSTNMGITGAQMEGAFGILLAQGKAGAVELKDMAGILAGLTPQFSQFATKGVDGLSEMGANLQIMRSGFGSASETATGFTGLMTALVKNAKDLKKLGVNVFEVGPNGEKRLRGFSIIVRELINASKGDPEVLMKVLGRQEAVQALLPIMAKHQGAIDELFFTSKEGVKELQKDAAAFAELPAAKIAKAKAAIQATLNESLAKILPIVAGALERISKAIGNIADSPMGALTALLAWKGGGLLSAAAGQGGGGGAGGAMGLLGGGAAALAGGGGPAWQQRMFGRGLGGADLGGALQGGAMGYMIADSFGADGIQTAAATVTGALAMLPGPIGMVGKAIAGLEAGILAIFAEKERELNERREAHTKSAWAGGGTAALGIETTTDPDKMRAGVNKSWAALNRWASGEDTDEDRETQKRLLMHARAQGFIKTDENGQLVYDRKAAEASIAGDTSLDKGQKAHLERAMYLAFNSVLGKGRENDRASLGDTTVGGNQFVQDLLGGYVPTGGQGMPRAPGPTQDELAAAVRLLADKVGAMGGIEITDSTSDGVKASLLRIGGW